MNHFAKAITASIMGATMLTSVAVTTEQAAAAPFIAGAQTLASHDAALQKVYWRGHGGGWGWGPGALIGGIVGGALISSAVSEHRADRADMARCDRDFPEFSYRTGTYIDRRGNERVCPYLR
jgi:hypothetical protein